LCLQQLTLLVAGALASSIAAVIANRLGLAGFLLALAMVKPQLAIGIAAFLLVWAIGDWKSRKSLVKTFVATMILLVVGAEILLPGWIHFWRDAVKDYVGYHKPALIVSILSEPIAIAVAVVAIFALGALFWHFRKTTPGSEPFNFALVSVLVVTTLFLPNAGSAYYNHVILIPGTLWLLFRKDAAFIQKGLTRVTWLLASSVLLMEWIATIPVVVVTLISRPVFERETSSLLVTGPEFVIFSYPLAIFLFVLSMVPYALAQGAQKQRQDDAEDFA